MVSDADSGFGDAAGDVLGQRLTEVVISSYSERRSKGKLLVRGAQESLALRGLQRADRTVAGGERCNAPRVVSADAGPPGWMPIDLSPGQSAEDIDAHASAIAQHLGVSQVRVVTLGRSRVRLELPAPPDGS
jgi:hypothetical protein